MRQFHSLLLVLMLPATGTLQAQADSVGFIPRKNLIKIGITSSFARTISLDYERVLNPELSVALTVSYMTPAVPSGFFDLDAENITFSADRKLTGLYFTPEVKWFVEKSDKRPAPRGLYVGAYVRYSDTRYTADLMAEASGTDASGSIRTFLQIDLVEMGIGPQVGYQFLAIKDRLVFDAVFFAPRFSLYSLKVKADLQGDGKLADDLAQAIEDKLGRQVVNTSIDLSSTGSTTIDRNSLGYRYGIKIGYAF
ncbi:MAG: hypothetical protein R2818_02840 [Flavobacteriales bacterium]